MIGYRIWAAASCAGAKGLSQRTDYGGACTGISDSSFQK